MSEKMDCQKVLVDPSRKICDFFTEKGYRAERGGLRYIQLVNYFSVTRKRWFVFERQSLERDVFAEIWYDNSARGATWTHLAVEVKEKYHVLLTHDMEEFCTLQKCTCSIELYPNNYDFEGRVSYGG